MSDKVPKCIKCGKDKNMHKAIFPKKDVYVEEWLCLVCDKQDYEFKDVSVLNKSEERDE